MGYFSIDMPTSVRLCEEPNPLLVAYGSPRHHKLWLEKIGKYFQREFRYDIPPFLAAESVVDPGFAPYEAYLFHEFARDLLDQESPNKHRCIGACCFRKQIPKNAPAFWLLGWVWFHPFARGRGHLANAWPMFEERYGHFAIKHPLSPSMKNFLERRGYDVSKSSCGPS